MAFKEHDPLTGITTVIHDIDDKRTFQKTYDAQPFIETAEMMRQATEGQKWGEMRHVGYIPMAELGKMMRQDGGIDQKRVVQWLKENPKLITFEKLLK